MNTLFFTTQVHVTDDNLNVARALLALAESGSPPECINPGDSFPYSISCHDLSMQMKRLQAADAHAYDDLVHQIMDGCHLRPTE